MSHDFHDKLMDQLLREVLGGDRPRDLTTRVLTRARVYDSARRRWWIGTAASVAASIAIVAALFLLWPGKGVDGDVAYVDVEVLRDAGLETASLERGRIVVTGDEGAEITLGGYVNIDMGPQTSLTLGGARKREKIFLEHGSVDIAVTKKIGSFEVAVGQATVRVTGTRFRVGVVEDTDLAKMQRVKRLLLEVDEGSVLLLTPEHPNGIAVEAGKGTEYTVSSKTAQGPITRQEPPKVTVPEETVKQPTPPPTVRTLPTPTVQTPPQPNVTNVPGIGSRGTVRPAEQPAANRGRAAQTRPAQRPKEPLVKPLQIIVSKDSVNFAGVIRRSNELSMFYLDSPRGWIAMFPVDKVPAGLEVPLEKRAMVFWDQAKVVRITLLPEAR